MREKKINRNRKHENIQKKIYEEKRMSRGK